MLKRVLSIILVCLFLVSLVSCDYYKEKYPDYLTGEYVQEHYELVDMNLVYLQSHRRRTSPIWGQRGYVASCMAIKDVPLEQFIGIMTSTFIFPARENYVLFHSESSVNPIYDFEVERIELYDKHSGWHPTKSNFDRYGELLHRGSLCDIENPEIIQEMLRSIRYGDREDIYAPVIKHGVETVAVRIHFKEYKNIVWDAEVSESEGKYYLEIVVVNKERGILALDGRWVSVYVGQQFDALMESIIADL